MSGRTLFDKIWDMHVAADLGDGNALLHVDRLLLHDLSGARGLAELGEKGLEVRNPELAFAVPDHAVSSAPGRGDDTVEISARLVPALRRAAHAAGIRLFDINDPEQGIVHIIGPEQGITLPGTVLCCGDSHTSTHGGLGALAFGIGSTEIVHVLATQTIIQKRPKTMRVTFDGDLALGVTPKDMILHLIAKISAAGGDGYAVEYAGSAIRGLPIEGRLTICNMSIEMGAKVGMVAPDDKAFDYLHGRPYTPKDAAWDGALAHWRTLASDDDAGFDREVEIDVARIEPQITWGTSPEHTIPVGAAIPDPAAAPDAGKQQAWQAALDYMGLEPGRPIAGTPVDRVFIGSCTNSRLSDLRAAAEIARGRRVSDRVTAWVVPGSQIVKRDAEAEGLDRVFREAGFEWREPGCSQCVAANGEVVAPGERSVSTTNRNFVGRQGPRARTHLASPAMAAAAAIAGEITDVRRLES
ncbi:MAG: 3-isopropylmalate dehydratase large subunit [Hyphomicrobiales bacterium]|nr:3-isopropylmalate dehydratase large subunit [Hyphomicrobiales bacterium]